MLYKTPSSFADMTFRSPGFHAFLDSLPDGYFVTVPPVYEGLLARSTPEVQAWGALHLPGTYQVTPLYDVFDLPFFSPSVARAPGLVVQGELDPNQSLDDTLELARDYGSGAGGAAPGSRSSSAPVTSPASRHLRATCSSGPWFVASSIRDRIERECRCHALHVDVDGTAARRALVDADDARRRSHPERGDQRASHRGQPLVGISHRAPDAEPHATTCARAWCATWTRSCAATSTSTS